MKKRNKAVGFFIGLLRFILIIVMIASVFAVTVSAFLSNTVINEKFYKNQLTSDTYIREMSGHIGKAIKASCLYYGLPYDDIMKAITDESIKEVSEKYAIELYKSMKSGDKLEEINYPSENIKAVLDGYFKAEKADIDDETVQLIADDLAGTVSANIVAVKDSYGNINILKPLSKYVFSNKYVQLLAKYSSWIIILCAAVTVLALLLCASTLRKRLYTVANVYWLAGCVMFIPVLVFNNHDIFSKIALTDSPVKSFVDIIGKPMIQSLLKITTAVFVIACVFLVLAFIAFIVAMVKRRRADKDDDESDAVDTEKDIDNSEASDKDSEDKDGEASEKADKTDDKLSDKDIDDIVNEIYKSSEE